MKRSAFALLSLFLPATLWAAIPATPVMTIYKFNGPMQVPYYRPDSLTRPAGYLTQGSSLIPCLAIRNGRPVTDSKGTPYVGFEIVVDSSKATRSSTKKFKDAVAKRQGLKVKNHHCGTNNKYVINVRSLYALKKAPFFDPPGSGERNPKGDSELDTIVRTFHNSKQCEGVNRDLTGRRGRLKTAWDTFIKKHKGRWTDKTLARAKHLDYTMRTAIYEGHLDRGCSAYGACERNTIALSIRNRARGQCAKRQGCRFGGDFQGVASAPSQYNIWDEFLTQISGLTSCYLRDDLRNDGYYQKIQRMYAQNIGDVETILYGSDQQLKRLYPNNSLGDLSALRHYYHAPAMGKCFPDYPKVEYMSGAVAQRGGNFALIANTRSHVDRKSGSGYYFREFRFEEADDRDIIDIIDSYPGFVVDGRRVNLGTPSRCLPYGISRGCGFGEIGRYRRTPPWLTAGKSLELTCRIQDQGNSCKDSKRSKTINIGGRCDTQMRPVSGVH